MKKNTTSDRIFPHNIIVSYKILFFTFSHVMEVSVLNFFGKHAGIGVCISLLALVLYIQQKTFAFYIVLSWQHVIFCIRCY